MQFLEQLIVGASAGISITFAFDLSKVEENLFSIFSICLFYILLYLSVRACSFKYLPS